jgi:prolyl-tRNA editing enzyme YbaK/EbsC (Cys-tRNA(Pro) deacylase)
MKKEKKKALWVDEDTHYKIAVMAVTKKLSIGKVLKELVDTEKNKTLDGENGTI